MPFTLEFILQVIDMLKHSKAVEDTLTMMGYARRQPASFQDAIAVPIQWYWL